MRFSFGEITTATGCWRRSARFTAEFRKLATLSVADAMRTLSSPADIEGAASAVMIPMIPTTTIISTSVMPAVRLVRLPADNVGIDPFAAGLSVGAEAGDLGVVPV